MDEKEIKRLLAEFNDENLKCEREQCVNLNAADKKVIELVDHQFKNHMSYTATVNTAKLMNNMPGVELAVPESKCQIMNRVPRPFSPEYFVICQCENLVKNGEKCDRCFSLAKKNSKQNNFVAYIPIIPQVKAVLNEKLEIILNHLKREHKKGIIGDVDDGILFHKLKAIHSKDAKLLTFTVNADGANIFRSSKHSLWLVQIYQNYLPPQIRYRSENILLVTLLYQANKPKPFHLMSLLAREMDNAVISAFDGNEILHFVPTILNVVNDVPAKALLQNTKLPNGKMSCSVCYHPGESVPNLNTGTTIRYVKSHDYPLRTHTDTVIKASSIKNDGDSVDGIKGYSCMLMFDNFDIIDSFGIDFMHGIALGIVKDVIEIWLGTRKIPPVNNNLKIKLKDAAERKLLSDRISQLKPLMHFRRKPRSILDIATFKATELLHLLIYYMRFSIGHLLPTKLVKHFELLSAAIFILCKREINEDDLKEANIMLIRFADDFEAIYGKGAVTMNVHMLRHYDRMVRLCGPLWTTALFAFESNIGAVKKLVSGTADIVHQIAEKYTITKGIGERETNINSDNGRTFLCQLKKIQVTDYHRSILEKHGMTFQANTEIQVARRLKLNDHTYTSIISNETKSADYFLKISDGSLGTAEFYFKFNDENYVLLNIYSINHTHYHLTEIKKENTCRICSCKEITKKLLYLKVNSVEFIADEINGYFL